MDNIAIQQCLSNITCDSSYSERSSVWLSVFVGLSLPCLVVTVFFASAYCVVSSSFCASASRDLILSFFLLSETNRRRGGLACRRAVRQEKRRRPRQGEPKSQRTKRGRHRPVEFQQRKREDPQR